MLANHLLGNWSSLHGLVNSVHYKLNKFVVPSRTKDKSSLSFPLQRDYSHVSSNPLLNGIINKANLSDGLLLIKPLSISISREPDGSFFIEDDVFSIYGIGENPNEAVKDLLDSLGDYYLIVEDSLKNDQRNLRKFKLLSDYIVR